MGKNYDTDAELRSIDMWVCKTCGMSWPVESSNNKTWTAEDAEKAARTCCSENSPCWVCGERRTRTPHHACDRCAAIRDRERWEACEVRHWEFPMTLQDSDQWFWDEDDLDEYCLENDLKVSELLLRIGKRESPHLFDATEFWCDILCDCDDDPIDAECRELARKINAWARENIIFYQMGPFRPQLPEATATQSSR